MDMRHSYFSLCHSSIPIEVLRQSLQHSGCGGYVAFEGWVRDHNEGRRVLRLEYEAFASLAEREAERILEEARRRYAVHCVACAHRVGSLAIGEIAVWVGASGPHRGAAFDACRYIIDEVKHRLPIWKKEFYEDGDSGWVNCEHCAAAVHDHDHDHDHDHAHEQPEQ